MTPTLTAEDTAPTADADAPPERSDDDILEEIRERKTYASRAWQQIREDGRIDALVAAGEVWEALDPEGLAQRKSAGRPAIAPDEAGQYVNQIGNDVRQNKRGVKVTPTGNGANDKTAEFRQSLIRQIEYESNAQRDVYSPIFEDALVRGYGYGRINAVRVSDLSKNQKLVLEAFPNPDVVTPDPDGAMLSPDCSKIQYCFIGEVYKRKQIKRDFPDAQITDFTDEHMRVAPDWFKGDGVTVAEYWTIEKVKRTVVYLKIDPSRGFFLNKLPRPPLPSEIAEKEVVDAPYVCHYLTNGLELLAKRGKPKREAWPGKSIPVFSCYGKVVYVQNGNTGTERRLMGMIRLARGPIMAYSYTRTCQIEVIGSVPRSTWVGYEGQFRGHEEEWAEAAHVPKPFLVARATTEATGAQILPLPERQSWDPPLQNLEMQAEAFRRSIQAALQGSPLPTDAQKLNQKSKIALDKIESSGQKGSYHFVDHLDGMIARVGVLLDEQFEHRYDTARDVTVRKPDEQSETVRINDPSDPKSIMLTPDQQHDVTISVGPHEQSQRAASSDFADLIVANPNLMQTVGPQKAAELTALAIRLKSVGPIGDEMADIISPKPADGTEAPTPAQVAELQAQGQQLQQQNQELQQAVQTDQAKQQAQIQIETLKQQGEHERAAMDADLQIRLAQMQHAAQIEVARINAEKQASSDALKAAEERLATGLELLAKLESESEGRMHAVGMAAMGHSATATEAERARAATADEAERGREAAAEGASAEREHAAEMAEAAAAREAAAGAGA